ncbi:MAG: hypothetical protein M1838_002515 [Thelocarpon superellum]|nr:MAG: hypothetical protein M1838_002515 [Thelocarpon superellum]
MTADLTSARISPEEFDRVLARYEALIETLSAPSRSTGHAKEGALETLAQLDAWRLKVLPDVVRKREKGNGSTWLEKSEVETLVKWKLKHGKFRPRLLQLAESNAPTTVKDTTRNAFARFASVADPAEALKTLSSLKGVGPATASLLLSIFDPTTIPFFSDECFRWVMYDEPGRGRGWDRKIKYDAREYADYLTQVQALRTRLAGEAGRDVSAQDVERVGFVVGKEAEPSISSLGKRASPAPAQRPVKKSLASAESERKKPKTADGTLRRSTRSNR